MVSYNQIIQVYVIVSLNWATFSAVVICYCFQTLSSLRNQQAEQGKCLHIHITSFECLSSLKL